MTESVFVDTAKHICFWMIFSFITMAAFSAHAATVNYTLDNVILADGQQITGAFEWTFDVGDFEGGSGAFTALEIPWTPHLFGDPDLNMEIQTTSIEITGVGSYHDAGLDIRLKFDPLTPAFTPTQSALLDLDLSFFECCGNGFKDQAFLSGSVSPNIVPGDGNFDGHVNGLDYLLWAGNFGDNPADDPPGSPGNGDYDNNGVVNGLDYLLWAGNFGQGPNDGVAVPEPTACAMALLAFVAFLASPRRRRRYLSTSTIFAFNSGECGVA